MENSDTSKKIEFDDRLENLRTQLNNLTKIVRPQFDCMSSEDNNAVFQYLLTGKKRIQELDPELRQFINPIHLLNQSTQIPLSELYCDFIQQNLSWKFYYNHQNQVSAYLSISHFEKLDKHPILLLLKYVTLGKSFGEAYAQFLAECTGIKFSGRYASVNKATGYYVYVPDILNIDITEFSTAFTQQGMIKSAWYRPSNFGALGVSICLQQTKQFPVNYASLQEKLEQLSEDIENVESISSYFHLRTLNDSRLELPKCVDAQFRPDLYSEIDIKKLPLIEKYINEKNIPHKIFHSTELENELIHPRLLATMRGGALHNSHLASLHDCQFVEGSDIFYLVILLDEDGIKKMHQAIDIDQVEQAPAFSL